MEVQTRLPSHRARLLAHIDETDWIWKLAWMVGFAALTALLAQVRFYAPWNPYVPYTGQVLGLVLSGLVLGPRLGMGAMTFYLAAGAVGAPVFADRQAGLDILLGATGGYLFGFLLAAGLTGWLSRRWLKAPGERHLARLGAVSLLCLAAAFGVGALLLGVHEVLLLEGVGFTVLVSSIGIVLVTLLLLKWSRAEAHAFLGRIACGILGVLAVYVPGVFVLAWVTGMGWGPAIAYGGLQFIPVDLAKVGLAAGVGGLMLPESNGTE